MMAKSTDPAEVPIPRAHILTPALVSAVAHWADATTDPATDRRRDLIRDKSRAVSDFFVFVDAGPAAATSRHVKAWQVELEGRGLSPASVYSMVSRVSSFFEWAMKEPSLAEAIPRNPVRMARPKAPRAYQNESAQALDDDQVRRLVEVVRRRADAGNVTAKRDYALLLFYLLTGMRRREVIQLRWGDLKLDEVAVIRSKAKGGLYSAREVRNPAATDALLDYLRSSGRLSEMKGASPLWTRHDRAGKAGAAMTSHAFVENLKKYAREAGIPHIHLHQTRHTFARLVSEQTGSIIETQDALGHANAGTTRGYVQRIAVKKDRFSLAVAARLGLEGRQA